MRSGLFRVAWPWTKLQDSNNIFNVLLLNINEQPRITRYLLKSSDMKDKDKYNKWNEDRGKKVNQRKKLGEKVQ